MSLTRDFRETIQDRAQKDPAFRKAMLAEAIDAFLSGHVETGKAMLRDYINATIGFETLSKKIQKPSKSLHRMLSPAGNPNTNNFFRILHYLQSNEGVELVVTARQAQDTAVRDIAP
ncbi:MAG: transcriptional regulator [Thermodesulfobacteriota bacterium]|nr:transcriptional regulator [Thermodesulfobacteriota bacterium]